MELAIWIAYGAPSERLLERLPERAVAEVERLLRVVEHHDPVPEDGDGQVVSDAHLAVLSAPSGEYRRYVEQLRLDDATRLAQLDDLLARDSLYRTPEMRAGREARAQLNMARERAFLRRGSTTAGSAARRSR